MSRTGLSPADIAESFRDRCGDGSMEWVCTPTQTWVLLDAADMLDENAKLRELASGIGHLLFSLDVDYCAACPRDGVNHPCPVHTACGGECLYKTDLRELGVDA